MLPLTATLALLATAAESRLADAVGSAVREALAVPSARAEVVAIDGVAPHSCEIDRADVPRPIRASGRLSVRIRGTDASGRACDGWIWARVRVLAPVAVTERKVHEGDAFAGSATIVDREIDPGRAWLSRVPDDARAARHLLPGTPLDESAIRLGPGPGQPVTVVFRDRGLVVEQQAHAVACTHGKSCALLPSGRRVEGAWHGGRIELDAP